VRVRMHVYVSSALKVVERLEDPGPWHLDHALHLRGRMRRPGGEWASHVQKRRVAVDGEAWVLRLCTAKLLA